ncbi:TonB-dependent receptor [Umboniibacter marinipuniceus]|uniref:Iron complex outermembrane receptor protein n=1 Tax=Umboniibacter marinipuniceus TaxID=569599 RepID=A0A3M0A108_9GAMM|nr:TonB-dependent receptor [Umboniibacter marinipuniceus]RMA78821.1 iron complex outermembrane receptor protein [Umboniibacter marinipuniceus]
MPAVNTFRRSRLAASISMVLGGVSAGALHAQDQDQVQEEAVVEEVVVTGFRASLEDSVATKRDSSSIVEAISAEDIGKLPDVSIAESLGRLPGLTVQRLNGRGQVVAVRGMSPDFSTGLLNGREQVSVGDNRGVEFDQYPSELLHGAVVYKTPDAALIGQGLSGTVDLHTVRPLEYGERNITINAKYEALDYDLVSNRDNTGNRFSATYIDQFADETIGLMLGYSHTKSPNQGQHFNSWGYYNGDGNGNNAIGGGRLYARAGMLERDSFVTTVEFAPSDRMSASMDVFYSEFTEDQIKHGMALCLACGATMTVIDTKDGVVTEGIYDGVKNILENNQFKRDAESLSVGFNVEFQLNDQWNLEADVSHSSIDRSDIAELETNAGTGPNGQGALDTVHFWSTPDGTQFETALDYTNVDYNSANPIYVTSPAGWGDPSALAPYQPAGQFGYNKVFDVSDDINAFRAAVSGELDFGVVTGVEMGYNYTSREKTRVSNEGVITSNVTDANGDLLDKVEIPSGIVGQTSLDFGLRGANTSMLAYDPSALLASGVIQQGAYLYNDILAKAWEVNESVNTVYVKFDVDAEIGDMPLTGNFGVQYQFWDQDSRGQNATGAGSSIQSEYYEGEASDSEILPSLNLSLAVTDDQIVRLGLARTLARPRMDEMRASGTYGYNANNANTTQADIDALIASGVSEISAYQQLSPWGRGGGNIELTPWVADAVDLSYEYYFEDGLSYVSGAVFYKDLQSYIFNQNVLFDFTGLPPQGPAPQIYTGVSNQPVNGEGGSIEGYELTASINFGLFADSLSGFGIFATYSKNDSEIEPNGPGSNSRLPGLSEDVYNLTAYYEDHGFSARINQRYRSDYVGEVSGFGGARTGSDIAEETIVDAQIGYSFDSGSLEGLTVMLQGLNLTNEPFRTVDVNTGYATEYQTYGSSYMLGASYTF